MDRLISSKMSQQMLVLALSQRSCCQCWHQRLVDPAFTSLSRPEREARVIVQPHDRTFASVIFLLVLSLGPLVVLGPVDGA